MSYDSETHNDNKNYTCGSIVGNGRYGPYEKVFFHKEDVIKEIKTNRLFKNSYLFATNLGFDFWATFFTEKEKDSFQKCYRSSNLIFAKTFFKEDEFCYSGKMDYKSHKTRASLTFVDSLNYAKMSVKQMGESLGLPKLDMDEKNFNEFPTNWQDPHDFRPLQEMVKYNIRDSWITQKFMERFYDDVQTLGATPKLTIASTAMSLIKNKYLGDYKVWQPSKEILRDIFKGYYGGRTETFKRGIFHNANYYDINSLYPAVMYYEIYPDPNTMRINKENTTDYILNYEGVSECTVDIPECDIGPLPYRHNDKLLFPGNDIITGSWCHNELRNAIDNGCRILHVQQSIWFKKTLSRDKCPLTKYIEVMYPLRQKYQKEGNEGMQKTIKLMMNSPYGKLGEGFDDKENYIEEKNMTIEMLSKYKTRELVGTGHDKYFRVTEDQEPKAHCIPIWAAYIAAYGRIRLYQYLIAHDPIMCDTDSLITFDTIPTSQELGDMKLEYHVEEGITVRPKFYSNVYLKDGIRIEQTKIKGLGTRMSHERFKNLPNDPTVEWFKFAKFKEANRRGYIPNEILHTHKTFGLEDSKRDWMGQTISFTELQNSKPPTINQNEIHVDINIEQNLFSQLQT